MGALCSTEKKLGGKELKLNIPVNIGDDVRIDSPSEYDQKFVDVLRKEFFYDFETFILNHILMSVLFFENYERDILKLSSAVSEWERNYNKQMISEYQKQCLMPDTLLELVCKNIRFRPYHGKKKDVSESISSQRLYIIHDNIEIQDPFDNSLYTKIDKPAYKALIEESKLHKGYVRVRQIDLSKKRFPYDYLDKSDSDDSIYETLPKNLEASTSGGMSRQSSDSEYDYSRLSEFKTPAPLNIEQSDIYTEMGTLPSKCLTPVRTKNRKLMDDDEDEDEEDNIDHENYITNSNDKSKLYIFVNYFNSKEFMLHFCDKVFPNVLGTALGLTDEEIFSATFAECKVYCRTNDEQENLVQFEIFPAISIPWPTLAFEWSNRDRPVVNDTRAMIRYQWPTENMIREIKSFNGVIVPKGFMPKKNKQTNPTIQLEWEVAFPKAEKYLEARMSYAQIKCYLILLTLHKTFIEPLTLTHGLRAEHVRNLMFWECEKNYMSWSDCKLWIKLKELLKNLDRRVGVCKLPDYFIKGKNVFENIQTKYLVAAKENIFKILESPVPHLIKALRNLRIMSGRFYPTPDLKRLYVILSSQNYQLLGMTRPLSSSANGDITNGPNSKKRKSFNPDRDQEWRLKALERQKIERLKKNSEQTQKRDKQNLNSPINRKDSTDSIDVSALDNMRLDEIKRRSILMFFIDHFVSIAKTSNKIGSTKQTLFYLKQAWYLTRLLSDFPAYRPDVLAYEKIINREEELCQRKAESPTTPTSTPPTPPHHPKRNSHLHHSNSIKTLRSQSSAEEPSPILKKKSLKFQDGDETIITNNEKRKTISFIKTNAVIENDEEEEEDKMGVRESNDISSDYGSKKSRNEKFKEERRKYLKFSKERDNEEDSNGNYSKTISFAAELHNNENKIEKLNSIGSESSNNKYKNESYAFNANSKLLLNGVRKNGDDIIIINEIRNAKAVKNNEEEEENTTL